MHRIFNFALIALLIVAGPASTTDAESAANEQPSLTDRLDDFTYGGETRPGTEPVIFAKGIVSSPDSREMGCSMAPDGNEFYFVRTSTDTNHGGPVIWVSRIKDGEWAAPEMVSFTSVYMDFSPFVTYDNKYMLFYRMGQKGKENEIQKGTWISERTAAGWSEPKFFVDRYCVTTADFRTFYFSFERDDEEGREIGYTMYKNGKFSKGLVLPGGANSPEWDAHSYISPDGSYIMFDSQRPGGFDEFDMYVSFLREDGAWSEAKNLGEAINSGHHHMPSISPDGKYLFFSAADDIWWVSLNDISKLE